MTDLESTHGFATIEAKPNIQANALSMIARYHRFLHDVMRYGIGSIILSHYEQAAK